MRRNNEGAILIFALWVVALLSLLAVGMMSGIRLSVRQEAWRQTELDARELLAAFGMYTIDGFRQDSDVELDSFIDPWGAPVRMKSDELLQAYPGADADREEFLLSSVAVDEWGKINVNVAPPELIEEVLRSIGVTDSADTIAAAIVDWRDADDTGFAESQVYSEREPPYAAANTDLARIEELLFVEGVTQEKFYGDDWNRNGVLDPQEDDGDQSWPPDNADGVMQPGLIDVFTVYGEGDVNINTAGPIVIRALLVLQGADEAKVDALVKACLAQRRGADGLDGTEDDKPFTSPEELAEVLQSQLGADSTSEAQQLASPFGLATEAVRFYLAAGNPSRHYAMHAEFVAYREDDRIRVAEWRDL